MTPMKVRASGAYEYRDPIGTLQRLVYGLDQDGQLVVRFPDHDAAVNWSRSPHYRVGRCGCGTLTYCFLPVT